MSAPATGYVPYRSGASLLPVLGVPGAALVGDPLSLPGSWYFLAVAPSQDYLLATERTSGALLVVTIGTKLTSQTVAGAIESASQVAFSPSGSAAVVLSGSRLQVVTGLPSAPSASTSTDVAALGSVSGLAVTDDGSYVLAASGTGTATALYLVSAGGELRSMAQPGQNVTFAFANNSHRAAMAGLSSGDVWTIADVTATVTLERIAGSGNGVSGPVGVAFTTDNQRVVVAHSAGVAVADLSTASVTAISCSCTPTLLSPMHGNSVFRLTEPSAGPMWLFEGTAAAPRVWFVPPQSVAAERGGLRK